MTDDEELKKFVKDPAAENFPLIYVQTMHNLREIVLDILETCFRINRDVAKAALTAAAQETNALVVGRDMTDEEIKEVAIKLEKLINKSLKK